MHKFFARWLDIKIKLVYIFINWVLLLFCVMKILAGLIKYPRGLGVLVLSFAFHFSPLKLRINCSPVYITGGI